MDFDPLSLPLLPDVLSEPEEEVAFSVDDEVESLDVPLWSLWPLEALLCCPPLAEARLSVR